MTPSDLSTRWHCSTKTVKRIMAAGLIEYIRISPRVALIAEESVAEYEAKRTVKARRVR